MKFRVPFLTIARRVWSGEWDWIETDKKGRKRLGLVTTGGHRWILTQNASGCWLERTDNTHENISTITAGTTLPTEGEEGPPAPAQ